MTTDNMLPVKQKKHHIREPPDWILFTSSTFPKRRHCPAHLLKENTKKKELTSPRIHGKNHNALSIVKYWSTL
jgi:hypothetical protein